MISRDPRRCLPLALAIGIGLLPLLAPQVSSAQVRGMTRAAAREASDMSSQRTDHRVFALPAGYKAVYRGGVRYYYVGGIYYRPMLEAGRTVYVPVDL